MIDGVLMRRSSPFGEITYRMPGSRFGQKVRAVCHDCNHGWMNALDLDIRDIAHALSTGKRRTVTPSDAARLASWGTKVGLMRTLIDEKDLAHADPDLFERFYRDREPIAEAPLQIGLSGEATATSSNTWLRLELQEESGALLGSTTVNVVTISIGVLVLQVPIHGAYALARRTAETWLAASRRVNPGGLVPLSLTSPTHLEPTLSQSDVLLLREPAYLLGQRPFTGN